MALSWDYIAKLVVIGDSGTGKSSLTIRLCENRFVQQHDVTIGVEFGSQIVPVGPCKQWQHTNPDISEMASTGQPQKYMKLSLWDTAGQETYKSITRSYFRGASGALLVFDISRRPSFDSVEGWLHDLRQVAESNIVVILVGNKTDLSDSSPPLSNNKGEAQGKRQITYDEAWEWCRANGVFKYVETSAKNGSGVELAFLEVANRIYENIEAGRYDLNDRRSGVKSSKARADGGRQQDRVILQRHGLAAGQRDPGGSKQCC